MTGETTGSLCLGVYTSDTVKLAVDTHSQNSGNVTFVGRVTPQGNSLCLGNRTPQELFQNEGQGALAVRLNELVSQVNYAEAVKLLEETADTDRLDDEAVRVYVALQSRLKQYAPAMARVEQWAEQNPASFSLCMARLCLAQRSGNIPKLKNVHVEMLHNLHKGMPKHMDREHVFALMLLDAISAWDILPYAQRAAEAYVSTEKPFLHIPRAEGRLHIGYVSPDFREHPVARLILGVLRHHNRERFKIHAYHLGRDDGSLCFYRSVGYADAFHNVSGMPPEAVAQQIHADGIDVLVDLCGYMDDGMPELWASKPAPVIISYLGYLGSTGHTGVDYLIADAVTLPPEDRDAYTERPILLPRCYQVTDGSRIIVPRTREQLGISPEAFVFASPNSAFKVTPRCITLWSEILCRCPDAVLWLNAPEKPARKNLVLAFSSNGVDAQQLCFPDWMPNAHFLGALACADMFLDTLAYNAGTTASDALYAGCPVLTLPGRSFVSRMAASIVLHAGLPDMVAVNEVDYVNKAVRGYEDRVWLAETRARANAAKKSRLFDTVDATHCLEAAYTKAYDRFRAGLAPETILLEDPGWTPEQKPERPSMDPFLTFAERNNIAEKLQHAYGDAATERFLRQRG